MSLLTRGNTMSRVMLITGASRGIGAATARLAAHQGYALCLNYHQREDAVKQVLEQVHAAGVSAIRWCRCST